MKALALALLVGACAPSLVYSTRTPDRLHRVEVIAKGDTQFVVVDGVRTAGYRGVAVGTLTFSPNGAHLAFAARRGKGWIVVTDRVQGAQFDGIGELVVADDGRVAYAAEHAGTWSVVTSTGTGPPYDAILAGTLQLGAHLAYVARAGRGVYVVIDGAASAAFDGVGQLAIGDHAVYAARRGDRAFVVVDGTESPPWAAIEHLTVAGARVAYAALDETGWRVVADGEAGPAMTKVRAIVLDARHVAYLARAAEHEVVVVDSSPIAAAGNLRELALGPRGASYIETTGTGEQLVVAGARGATYDEIGTPVYANDRLAYAARRGVDWFVVDGTTEIRAGIHASTPVLSHDGRHLGFTAHDARGAYAMVDGRLYRFDLVIDDTLAFAKDDRAWSVMAGDLAHEKMFFATDRLPGASVVRVPLETAELYSAGVKRANAGLLASPDDTLVRWSAAEADRRARE
jgi:hypothetical protein